ncbi:hypothetical protein EHQ94_00065 [Leptospira meyeri]|uniref:hypothetical protein n=1 Tax=Leptospira meyeri TaxID=29508 RepID=UPI001082C68D|nr:hypothetical protein [Leptospira meyeri]TGM60083.1 hypothetical protein EHQ93_18065 [Leptospira meyeri]TGM74327.1 hypothetical protein EHQ94_00065 [Leptospira meyeri]
MIFSILSYFQCSSKVDETVINIKDQIIKEIAPISNQYNSREDLILYQKAKFLNRIEIKENEFYKDKSFFVSLDFRIINSHNFANSIVYNGKECKQLLKKYPKSEYIDDYRYLIHNIENEKKDFKILKKELNFLKGFLVTFPSTNLKEEILERIT